MKIELVEHKISGKIGTTVIYSIKNFRFDKTDKKLKWDTFRFYTPEGDETVNGFKCFTVPAGEVLVSRDDTLNKEVFLTFSVKNKNGEWIEVLESKKRDLLIFGLEGDIVVYGVIPANVSEIIRINFKEVF